MTQNLSIARIGILVRRMAVVALAAMLALASQASLLASNGTPRSAKLETEVQVDAAGDARITQTMTLPPQPYMQAKNQFPNALYLLRAMNSGNGWQQIEDMTAEFDDANFCINASYTHRGYVRVAGEGSWEFRFPEVEDPQLITSDDDSVILNAAVDSNFGTLNVIYRFNAPEGTTALVFDEGDNVIEYSYQPAADESGDDDIEFTLDGREQLMSTLAKLYADEQFANFWAARGVFRNTGSTALRNYRVRFRVDGHSAWSQWNKTKVVYPGQTVVDPFFPVLDLDQLASLNGSRPAMIQAEYEYETADGTTIEETDSFRVQIMSRNEVVFSSLPKDQVLSWYEANDYAPFILSAFTTSEDPIIQQLAGNVSGMAGGAAASYDDDEAIRFLSALWTFLDTNDIAYQTPPGLEVNGHFGQHIKYARDVLRNRAGTCVDLAILWASTAKAVGLRTQIVLIPGHAFPVIELPSGNLLPIESTLNGRGTFDQAVQAGIENLDKARNGLSYQVNIDAFHEQGVRGLDLPNVDESYLTNLGYSFNSTNAPNNTVEETDYETTANPDQDLANALVGTWLMRTVDGANTSEMYLEFNMDATFTMVTNQYQNGTRVSGETVNGSWSVLNSELLTEDASGPGQFPFHFENGDLVITIGEYIFTMVRQ